MGDLRARSALLTLSIAILLGGAGGAHAAVPAGNLIANPGAEADTGALNEGGGAAFDVSGFEPETGSFTAIQYGQGAFPTTAHAAAIGGGANFFAGGDEGNSSGTQQIDVSVAAAEIDRGSVQFTFSALLGGFDNQEDNAAASIEFLGSGGGVVGTTQLGPVTAADRGNERILIPRRSGGTVPPGTRVARVSLVMTRASGLSNDGYADNLSLTLSGGAGPSPGPTTTVVTPPKPGPLTASKGKQKKLPGGGRQITVTPATPCDLKAKTTLTPPKKKGPSSSAAPQAKSVLTFKGGTKVKVPSYSTKTFLPNTKVKIPVVPVTVPPKKAPAKKPLPNPPVLKATTTVSCKPIFGAFSTGSAALTPTKLVSSAAAPKPVKVPTKVDPPKSNDPKDRKLETGVWRGTAQQPPFPDAELSFRVSEKGGVSEFRADGILETCFAPAASYQGYGVRSTAQTAGYTVTRPFNATPAKAFPKTANYNWNSPITTGDYGSVNIQFTDEDSAYLSLSAARPDSGRVNGAFCNTQASFNPVSAGKKNQEIEVAPLTYDDR